jgi:hypothetical protein
VSSYGFSGHVCDVGTGGTTDFGLPDGSFFFVIVGDDDTVEGTDGTRAERPPMGTRGLLHDMDKPCAQP